MTNPTDFFSEEAYYEALDEATRPLATQTDACREYAANVGALRPDQAWILTDYDTWEPNPYYTGPPARHPEDDTPGPPCQPAPPSPPIDWDLDVPF